MPNPPCGNGMAIDCPILPIYAISILRSRTSSPLKNTGFRFWVPCPRLPWACCAGNSHAHGKRGHGTRTFSTGCQGLLHGNRVAERLKNMLDHVIVDRLVAQLTQPIDRLDECFVRVQAAVLPGRHVDA